MAGRGLRSAKAAGTAPLNPSWRPLLGRTSSTVAVVDAKDSGLAERRDDFDLWLICCPGVSHVSAFAALRFT